MGSVVLLVGILLPVGVDPQEDWFRTGTGLGVEKIRLALPSFAAFSDGAETLAGIFNATLWNDLSMSGVVELVSSSFYPLRGPTLPSELDHAVWLNDPTQAHMVAYGNLVFLSADLAVNAWLSDVRNPEAPAVIAKRYRGDRTEAQARNLAHMFADEIVERLTGGQTGIARTQVAFVSTRRGKKEIWVMDYDGHDQRRVGECRIRCLTPRWSFDRTRLAYTSYTKPAGAPVPRVDIRLHSLLTNRPLAFPSLGGTTTTPAWSPDGKRLALSSSRTRDHEIYVCNADGSGLNRLTYSVGVDISPAWNPRTGDQIAFISDRGGSPQVYLMDADGSNVERLTNGGGYAATPAWSPNGQIIALSWQRESAPFDIYVLDVATRETVQLTHDAGRNEQPTWAPDGRHLVFQSTRSGRNQVWMMLADGTGLRQLTFQGANTAPQWSPR